MQTLAITGAIRKAKEGKALGGLPTRQTCQLAGPPVYPACKRRGKNVNEG